MAGEIYQIDVTGLQSNGDVWSNVYIMLENGVGGDLTALTAAVAQYVSGIYNSFADFMVLSASLDLVTVRERDPILGQWNEILSFNPVIAFTNAGDPLPGANSLHISARATPARRSGGKGFGNFSEGTITDGVWTAPTLAGAAAAAATYVSNSSFGASDLAPGTYSLDTETFAPFTGVFVVNINAGTQVTRKAGRGI